MQSVFLPLHLNKVWTELHSHRPLQEGPRFYIPLELTCCLFATYCHEFRNRESYDEFILPDLLKKNFKDLLFNSLVTCRSFENLSYLSSCSLSHRWRFQRIRSNVLWGIESDLAYTNVSVVVSQHILRSNIWHTLSSGTFKAAGTNMGYFEKSEFFGSLVHKKNFGLIWQVVFKLGCLFCQGR